MAQIDCIIEDDRWNALDLEALADCAVEATLTHLDLSPEAFEIALLACSDSRIAALNADFRAKATATNVLSWPSEDRAAPEDGGAPERPAKGTSDGPPEELGDIAIAWETCEKEAMKAGRPLPDHTTHLIIHAVLHLLGYDHERDRDATLMERIEVEILGKMGLPDPYDI